MKHAVMLTITSLLTILFTTFHLADDIVRGFSPGGLSNLSVVLVERRSGYVIVLVLSLLASGLPVIHMTGKGVAGGRIAGSSGAFFFVWTLLAVGVTAVFSVILAARGLWNLRRGQPSDVGSGLHGSA